MGLRELVALLSLQRDGMPLRLEAALAAHSSPLGQALASWLSWLALGSPSVITRVAHQSGPEPDGDSYGFVQVRRRPGRSEADLLYIGPASTPETAPPIWDPLLNAVTAWATANRVIRLFATVPADGPAEAVFRRNGYLRYAEETVYRLMALPPDRFPQASDRLRPQIGRDSWNLQRLYAATTPLRVQQAEGLLHSEWRVPTEDWNGQGWTESLVLEDSGGIRGHLGLGRGTAGHWFRVVTRPNAGEDRKELVSHALAVASRWEPLPIFCCVRHYQEGMDPVLTDWGFARLQQRALTVRHTVMCVRPALEEAVLRLQGAAGAGYNLNRSAEMTDGLAVPAGSPPSAIEWKND